MRRAEAEALLAEGYGAEAAHPWAKYPQYAVYRHAGGKWFALLMEIPREKLGLAGAETVAVLNLKCDPLLIGGLRQEAGIYPAYHMNKAHWITVLLDGSVSRERLEGLIEMSYALTKAKGKRPRA